MSKGLLLILKCAVMIAIVVLAVVASLYVLDVFEDQAIKEALAKLMSILGIFTGASLLLLVVANIGGRKAARLNKLACFAWLAGFRSKPRRRPDLHLPDILLPGASELQV